MLHITSSAYLLYNPIATLYIQFIATAEHKSDDTEDSEQCERSDRSEMGETTTQCHGKEVVNVCI